MTNDDEPLTLPRWIAETALHEHRNCCPYCRCDLAELCRDVEYTDELERALGERQ